MPDFARRQGILRGHKTEFEKLLELGERMFPGVNLPMLAVQAISEAGAWNDGPAKIDPLMVVWGLLTMCLHRQLSIDEAFELCLSWKEGGIDELERDDVTLNAFHNARKRLGYEPLEKLLASLGSSLPSTIDPVFGYRLIALDGSKINVPDTAANALTFGRTRTADDSESKYPQLLLNQLVTVHDRITRRAVILPGKSAESQEAFSFLDFLTPHDLLFVDRGIPSARLLRALLDRKIAFAVRIKNNWDVTVLKTHGPGDHLVRITREYNNEDGTKEAVTVEARLVEFRVGDDDVRLLTTLTDPRQVPAQAFCDLYHERWQIETAIGEQKNAILAPRRGRSPLLIRSEHPDLVKQELYATLIVHALVRNEGRRAAEFNGLEPRKLSFTRWFNSIRRLIHESAPGSRRRVRLGAKCCRLPRRKKAGRTYPRQVRQYQPKYKNRSCTYRQGFRQVAPMFATTARTMKGIKNRSG